jgi:hypothetical protein
LRQAAVTFALRPPASRSGALRHATKGLQWPVTPDSVDALDVDAPVLHRLDAVRNLDELASCGIGLGERMALDELHTLFLYSTTSA